MPIREVFFVAFEAIRGSKLRSSLTMLGMIIGVAAVVLLVSIGNGAKNYILREFESLGTNLIVVQPGKTDTKGGFGPPAINSKRKMTLADVEALQKQAVNIDSVAGIVFGTAAVKYLDKTSNSNLLGTNDQFNRIINIPVESGEFISNEEEQTGRRVVVLGQGIRNRLFGETPAIGQVVKINEAEHRVIGILKKSGEALGFNVDDYAFVPTKSAQRIFNDDKLMGLRVKAKTKVGMMDAVQEIREIMMSRNNGIDDVTIVTQGTMIETMNTILNMLTYVLAGIAFISLVVGGIGIMNIMLVSVTERTREIGIRRAVGARRLDIMKQFIVESVTLSIAGGAIGMMGSAFLTYLVFWLAPSFDMRAPIWIMIPAFLISVTIGVVAGVWPARKAANIETIEALRYE
jgi:putative ABC transport system permease protein